MEPSDEVLTGLYALAGVALSHDSLGGALDEVCRIAVRTVHHADGASLMTVAATGPQVAAASDDWSIDLDEVQFEEHEGPCLDAARTGLSFRVKDFTGETRWPSYAPRAVERGARSMMSIPMTVETKVIGAVNVYSRRVDAFGAEEAAVAEVIAGHASLATQVAAALHGHRQLAEQLRVAMESRSIIEQAKGIIMATVGCGPDAAFQRLVDQSQHQNLKLRDVAQGVVDRYGR